MEVQIQPRPQKVDPPKIGTRLGRSVSVFFLSLFFFFSFFLTVSFFAILNAAVKGRRVLPNGVRTVIATAIGSGLSESGSGWVLRLVQGLTSVSCLAFAAARNDEMWLE